MWCRRPPLQGDLKVARVPSPRNGAATAPVVEAGRPHCKAAAVLTPGASPHLTSPHLLHSGHHADGAPLTDLDSTPFRLLASHARTQSLPSRNDGGSTWDHPPAHASHSAPRSRLRLVVSIGPQRAPPAQRAAANTDAASTLTPSPDTPRRNDSGQLVSPPPPPPTPRRGDCRPLPPPSPLDAPSRSTPNPTSIDSAASRQPAAVGSSRAASPAPTSPCIRAARDMSRAVIPRGHFKCRRRRPCLLPWLALP